MFRRLFWLGFVALVLVKLGAVWYFDWQLQKHSAVLASQETPLDDVAMKFRRSVLFLLSGQFYRGVKLFNEIPNRPQDRQAIVHVLAAQGSVTWYDDVVLSLAHLFNEDLVTARQIADESLQRYPDAVWNRVVLGYIAAKRNHFDEGLRQLQPAGPVLKGHALVHAFLCLGYWQTGQPGSAYRELGWFLLALPIMDLFWILANMPAPHYPLVVSVALGLLYIILCRKIFKVQSSLWSDFIKLVRR